MSSGGAADLARRLKAQAFGLGFDLVGITTLGTPATRARFDAWLDAGLHGEMAYLAGEGAELRRDTRRPHAGATHAIVLATQYGGREPSGPAFMRAEVAEFDQSAQCRAAKKNSVKKQCADQVESGWALQRFKRKGNRSSYCG